jgi:arsenite methyltransferase
LARAAACAHEQSGAGDGDGEETSSHDDSDGRGLCLAASWQLDHRDHQPVNGGMKRKELDMPTDATFWNNLADEYSRKPVDDPDAFERKIAITKSKITPRDVVLDIGCGTGSLALRLAPCAAHVHGLDLSSEMIRIARGKAAAQRVDNVTFHVGPFDESVPFEPESLDGVCAYSLLHLVGDRPAALQRIYRLLRPGGSFVSSTVCLGESWVPYAPLLHVMRLLGKAPMVKVFSKQSLADEIRQSGFIDLTQPDVGAKPTIAFMVAAKPR